MRRSLGRGLTQILASAPAPEAKKAPASQPAEVPIGSVSRGSEQPRERFDEATLRELAASMRDVGMLQPLIVRPIGGGKYELIAGERRLRAAKLAGLKRVPIVVRSAGAQHALELALIENLQREDITPLECARAYRRLMDEFGLTQERVADRVGKSRPAVANTVRLLRLPERIQQGLEAGSITEGHARALLALDSPAVQLALYERILAKGLTVRDVEAEAQPGGPKKASGPKARRREALDPAWAEIASRLSERFGSPVRLRGTPKRGRLVIEFFSDSELERILEALGIRL